jgi:hypothetical protein
MHAVVRNYSGKGAKELADLLEKRTGDVESVMGSVKGLVSYIMVRTADGCCSVSVCNDKAGTEESVQKAREWIKANASDTGVGAPHISEGSVVVHLKK